MAFRSIRKLLTLWRLKIFILCHLNGSSLACQCSRLCRTVGCLNVYFIKKQPFLYFSPLTLHPLESIASSRTRLRFCFSAWGRDKDFNCDENVKCCGALLEQSLTAPLPAGCRAWLALHILNTLPNKTKTECFIRLDSDMDIR